MSRGIRSISIVRLAGLAALAGMVSACAQATRAGPGTAPGMYPLVIDGVVVRESGQVTNGQRLDVEVARGRLAVDVVEAVEGGSRG